MDAYLSQSQVQRQQQVLAPQLRQSLEFLQVPLMELRTLVAQELAANPTLEELSPRSEILETEAGRNEDFEDVSDREFEEEFQLLARLDDDSRDSFRRNEILVRPSSEDEEKRQFMLESLTAESSLQQHLLEQLAMSELEPQERQLAEMMIGSLDEDGYLTMSLEDLASSTGSDVDHLEYILHVVQEFDPVGVGSRSLQECLLKQLEKRMLLHTPAAKIIEFHLRELAGHKYAEIGRRLGMKPEDVQVVARFIATLNPKPGRQFGGEPTQYVMPEVFVRRSGGKWKVATNDAELPHLRISKHYRELMKESGTSREVKRYIRDKVRAGSFLMRSIGQRQQTIRRIAEDIVNVQGEFLSHGVSHLKPLTMAEVALRLGVHETTVSRAIANKFIQTPRGTYEMKYFFTPGYKTAGGGEVSNKTIKDAIKQLVAEEDPSQPLSDQAMVEALKAKGTAVARRTVAKYREELHILPSHLRKEV